MPAKVEPCCGNCRFWKRKEGQKVCPCTADDKRDICASNEFCFKHKPIRRSMGDGET